MDNTIQPDKLIVNERTKIDTTTQSQDKSVIVKESIPIGKILQNTVNQLSSAGLESINVLKVMVSAKELFPSEFTQIQLQQRQAQIDNPDTKTVNYQTVSETTKNNWFNGQVIHAKVLETHPDGRATILIDKQVIEIKLESNNQLKLEPGQNLALVIEKSTNHKLPNTTSVVTSANQSIVYKETVSSDRAETKETISSDKVATKETASSDKVLTKEAVISDKTVMKESLSSNKNPPHTEKITYITPPTNEKIANKENENSEKISTKETANSEKIRFLIANSPEHSSKLIQLIQSMVAKQQSLSPLLASLDSVFKYSLADKENLSAIPDSSKLKAQKLPIPVINAIQQLLSQFSSTQQLSISEGLKQAIMNSGLFLENRLQIQKTDNIDLSNLLINQQVTNNKFQSSGITENNPVLSQAINKLFLASDNFSSRINSKVSIPVEIIQLLNKNTANSMQNSMQLNNPPADINQILNKNQQITPQTTINEVLSKLNLMNQHVEKAITPTSTKNSYPKEYSQSINQLLENISKQFNYQNQNLLASKSHSSARTQALQFNLQIQQINQALSQAISNNNPQTTINPQINNDLKLNLHRLLSVLQELTTIDRSQTQTNTSQNKLISSLLQQTTNLESELNRPALVTRNQHAQVIMAQQNQLLQIANPLVFQQTLTEQIEGVMSRIIATQAASKEQADSNVNIALEIPFKFQDKSQVLQLKFTSGEKNKNKKKSKEKIWSANLAFELQSLGAIRIYILLDGKDVSMQFWTEKQSTQQVFAQNFSILRDRLKIAGYHISEMTASLGMPQEAEKEARLNKKGVIDEHV